MGEYQAVFRLFSGAKDFITPLIEVPEIGFDFEKGTPAKSVDDHLAPFAKRVGDKWKGRQCFVDMKLIKPSEQMADDQHPAAFIFDELRSQKCLATPVTGLGRDRSYQTAVRDAAATDQRGVCLRVSVEQAHRSSLKNSVDALLNDIGLEIAKCDLVLDLGAPNFVPVDGFAKLIGKIIQNLPYLSRWRTFTLIATSFPQSMAGIARGSAIVPRFEWQLYKRLAKILNDSGVRLPTFGDYAINHPDVLTLDMRLVKPFATIRYTTDDSWLIVRGSNVRDNGYAQYRDLCQTLTRSPQCLAGEFSNGDKYIADCAAGEASTGNLTTWRKVGTNHHLEKVVSDISSFFDSLGSP
jgi:hypothetical protein